LSGAVAAAVVTLVLFGPLQSVDTQSLAQIEPISLRIPRSVPESGSVDALWMQAITEYQRTEYAGAEQSLRSLLEREPSHFEATLLFGSALLLEGNARAAIPVLEHAEQLADSPEAADEVRWQLANALLSLSKKSAARRALDLLSQVAAGSSDRSPAAASLHDRLATQLEG
jgi:predicted Zn-dependent protease